MTAKPSKNPNKSKWPTYEEAVAKVRADKITGLIDYNKRRPDGLPSQPYKHYADSGWVDWETFTGKVNKFNRKAKAGKWPSYEEAAERVRALGITGAADYSKRRPKELPDLPSQPYKSYPEWAGWDSFLGKAKVVDWPGYEEAVARARALGFKTSGEYHKKRHLGGLPANPERHYRDSGWVDWDAFLDKENKYKSERPVAGWPSYRVAAATARAHGFKSSDEYRLRCPEGLPKTPYLVYEDDWCGWPDYLGYKAAWNVNAVLAIIRDLRTVVRHMSPASLLAVMRAAGVFQYDEASRQAPMLKALRDVVGTSDKERALGDLSEYILSTKDVAEPDPEVMAAMFARVEQAQDVEVAPGIEPARPRKKGQSLRDLHVLDQLAAMGRVDDEETVAYLVAEKVHQTWQSVFEGNLDPEDIRAESGGGPYFKSFREQFLEQYDGAVKLAIPEGYSFHEPNLMQRLAAYRVLTERRVGNWSGTGAGKTVSALLASRCVDARHTIIVAANNTRDGWARAIAQTFPGREGQYTVINYEKFSYSGSHLARLLGRGDVDMVIIDEVQYAKQRGPGEAGESKRRAALKELVRRCGEANPNLAVLGMSATPVINELREGYAILGLVLGEKFEGAGLKATEANCNLLHQKLMVHGIRWKPRYPIKVNLRQPTLDGDSAVPAILAAKGVLQVERALCRLKLRSLRRHVRPGTLIYCHYVDGVADAAYHFLSRKGYKVGRFTGDDRTGLDLFRSGAVDVLVASSPIGTGVDGLQKVCDRLVVLSLPWTGAEYEQLVGRIVRQGSEFSSVEVIIPQVVVKRDGQQWSWDRDRWARVRYKQGLADAAVDGSVFGGRQKQPRDFRIQAQQALEGWIARLEKPSL